MNKLYWMNLVLLGYSFNFSRTLSAMQ